MTNEELNTALYKKLEEEQKKFKQWLLTLSPKEILDNSFEYYSRENILLSIENNDLDDDQCKALMSLPNPLKSLFESFVEQMEDWDELDAIFDCVEYFADFTIGR